MYQMDAHLTESERAVGVLGIIVLLLAFLWMAIRWLNRKPVKPDPWGEQVSQDLVSSEATPLCYRCFTPHHPLAHFCPDCGAPVGACTNLLPFPRLFSVGHTLRIGTSGTFRRTPVTILGFFFMSFVECGVLAPIYWTVFIWALLKKPSASPLT